MSTKKATFARPLLSFFPFCPRARPSPCRSHRRRSHREQSEVSHPHHEGAWTTLLQYTRRPPSSLPALQLLHLPRPASKSHGRAYQRRFDAFILAKIPYSCSPPAWASTSVSSSDNDAACPKPQCVPYRCIGIAFLSSSYQRRIYSRCLRCSIHHPISDEIQHL